MRRTEPWLRRCRLAAAACLALPLLCFAVWDAVLRHAAPFAPDTAGALSAAGRADPTACLLYGCIHSLSLPLQGGADGWAQDPAPRSELAAGLLAQLEPLRQAGVLDDALYAAVDAAARAESSDLRRYTVPAGLTQYTLQSAGAAPALWLGAVFTPQGVPVYLEPISNEECTRTQESADYVWREVVLPDLNDCINSANFPDNTLTENYGRPSKGAAYALRGMAYMWLKEWQNAANDFSQVSKCGYDLWQGEYADFFTAANEKDNEMIFAIQYDEESGYCDNIQQAVGARDTYGGWDEVKPAADFVDYYQNADGTKFEWSQVPGLEDWDQLTPKQRAVFFCRDGLKSNSDLASQKTQAIGVCGQDTFDKYYLDNGNEARIKAAYENRDPRLKQTILTPYEPVDCYTPNYNNDENMIGKALRWPLYQQGTSGGDFWLDKRTSAYYCYRKYVYFLKGDLIDRQRCHTDFPLIRYTDVQLQWAEALIELNDFTTAKNLIDQVRTRAHMPGIQIGSLEEMRETVRYERRVEFPVEALNYFDEVRWGTYKQTKFQGKDVHGGQSWWGDDTVEYPWYWNDCLWPWSVPQGEYQRNPALTVRPGWIY